MLHPWPLRFLAHMLCTIYIIECSCFQAFLCKQKSSRNLYSSTVRDRKIFQKMTRTKVLIVKIMAEITYRCIQFSIYLYLLLESNDMLNQEAPNKSMYHRQFKKPLQLGAPHKQGSLSSSSFSLSNL